MSALSASADAIRRAMPHTGLFAEKDWLLSPMPFFVGSDFAEELDKLGYRLGRFIRACNLLYGLSVKGKQPGWIAGYVDRGKPAELVAISREKALRDEIPLVIRPDLILTEEGFVASELDSVPGGIGLTAWFNATYAALGFDVLGGAEGMLEGFRSILPRGGTIAVSRESATYRPEMEWLAARLGPGFSVADAETLSAPVGDVYRFFELFDLPNLPAVAGWREAIRSGALRVTPPFKPQLEEKMWFALFWAHPLREFWRRELGERHWLALRAVIPRTWIVDPAPVPHHAVLPGLEISAWQELADFSQKDRDLILKVSGFSEMAWGSRGVVLGSDLSHSAWKEALSAAVADFPERPRILQRFHKGKTVEQPYFDRETGALRTMQGRVRLCPYYFVADGNAKLCGALATVCPADKKLIHGMRDAVMAPAAISG